MVLHMDPIGDSHPLNTAEVDLAYRRVDAILRAYGMQHSAIRSAHTQRILSIITQANHPPTSHLEASAAQMVLEEIQQGLSKLSESIAKDGSKVDQDRLLIAVKKAQLPVDIPDALLGLTALTEEQTHKLRSAYASHHRPVLKRSSMGAAALRFESIDGITSRISEFISKIPFLKTTLPLVGALLLGLLIYWFAK